MAFSVTYGSLSLTGTDGDGVLWDVPGQIEGWDGSPGSTLALTQKPRASGAFIGNTPQLGARVLVIAGLIDAPDEDLLQGALDQLVNAVTLTAQTLTVVRGTRSRSLTVYRQDEILINVADSEALAEYSVQCVAPNPLKSGDDTTGLDGA